MTASLNEKLRTVKWGKYKTSELFQPQKITNMLSKEDLSEKFNFPAYSSESTNNGIIGYTDSPEFICDDEHPVFVTFGDHTCSFNEEHADFLRRLEIYDMNQSEFIREAISGANIKPTIVATLVSDDLLAAIGKLTAEYGRIGNNLNQIARHLNEWHSPYPVMAKELQDAAADLATLKFEVMKKVGDAVGNVQAYKL